MASQNVNDGIASLIGSLGDPSRDKNAAVYYGLPFVADGQLINAYRSSWLAQKIVNIPAKDSIRAGINWLASKSEIERLEGEQNRLQVFQKLYRALVLGRLLGGGALFLGTNQPANTPLNLDAIGNGGLQYLVVHSRLTLSVKDIDRDPLSPTFGKPSMYVAHRTIGGDVEIHPSRLVICLGTPLPEDMPILPGMTQTWGWSDSALLAPFNAIRNADVAPELVTSLLHEANIDHFGIAGFMDNMADPLYERRMVNRFSLVAANKGVNGTVLHDKDEVFERSSVAFGSIPDVLDKLMIIVSGAADIPMTRLFGQSPAGMSSTGESDLRNYYDRLSAEQNLELTPACTNLFECLIRSALNRRKASIWYKWSPLWQLSTNELADIGKKNSETARTLSQTGLVSDQALAKVVVNQMVETGFYPGLEDADAETPVDWELEAERQEEERQVRLGGNNFTTDATPRTLYVRRDVLNVGEIEKWAKAQGFSNVQTGLHVTVIHTRTPLDWIKVGQAGEWSSEDDGQLVIAPGGPRLMERFGDAIVLQFASTRLTWRHEDIKRLGAQTDYPEYQPHVTISWLDKDLDISKIEPYTGRIVLGPEIFAEVDDSWRAKIQNS